MTHSPSERRRDELKQLLKRDDFQNFIAWFLTEARILQPTYSADGGASLRSEGRRSLGLEVLRELQRADARACLQLLAAPIPQRDTGHDDRD